MDDPQTQSPVATELPPFLSANNSKPFIPEELRVASTPVPFRLSDFDNEPIAMVYRAELLPEVCNVYLSAREARALLPSQRHIAVQAEVLVRGLAITGIIALVDEATQYQATRRDDALSVILEEFIAKDLQPWTKTFPDEFYVQVYRLNDWGVPSVQNGHPSLLGHYTNDLVYDRLAPGVLNELRRLSLDFAHKPTFSGGVGQ